MYMELFCLASVFNQTPLDLENGKESTRKLKRGGYQEPNLVNLQ